MTLNSLMPWALALIMLALGSRLSIADFTAVLSHRRLVVTGLSGQLIVLPILAVLIALTLKLSPELALGLLLLSLCPGGITSNLFSHLSGGNTALSVLLTILSSLIAVFWLPLIYSIAGSPWLDGNADFQLPLLATVKQLLLLTALPVALGMLLKKASSNYSTVIENGLTHAATVAFAGLLIAMWVDQREAIAASFKAAAASAILLNVAAMLIGWLLAKSIQADRASTHTLILEVGVQNLALAFIIASVLMQQPALSIPAVCYSVTMTLSSIGYAVWAKRRQNRELTTTQ